MEQEDKKTVGQLLRAAREALGISREEAAAVTKIKPVFLAALEEDDYHLLPDERYLLRFLEEYARFLKIDAQVVQRRFAEQIARDPSSLAVFPVKRTITVPLRGLVPALLLLAIVIPSAFIGFSLLLNRPRGGQSPDRVERVELTGEASPVRPLPSAGETGAQAPVAAGTPTLSPPPVSPEVQAVKTLRALAKEMTWMLVTIDGRETRDVLLRAGETWEWRAQEGFILTVGNAGGVELVLDGRLVPPLGEPGQVVRDIRLPPESASAPEIR
jgi:transcriptional regulator with XRE-family HTH domain